MSDSVLLAQAPPLSTTSANTTAVPVLLQNLPAQIACLPEGTLLSALAVPGPTISDNVIVSLTMPDGSTLAFETHFSTPLLRPTPFTFKTIITDTDGKTALRSVVSTKTADTETSTSVQASSVSKQATEKISSSLPVVETDTDVVILKDKPVSAGFVLKQTPINVLKHHPDYLPEKPLPSGTKIVLSIDSVLKSPTTSFLTEQNLPAETIKMPTVTTPSSPSFSENTQGTFIPVSVSPSSSFVADIYDASAGNKIVPDLKETPVPQMMLKNVSASENDVFFTQSVSDFSPKEAKSPLSETKSILTDTVKQKVSFSSFSEIQTSATPLKNDTVVSEKNVSSSVLPETKIPTSSVTSTLPEKLPFFTHPEEIIGQKIEGVLFQATDINPTVIATRLGVFALDSKIRLPDLSTVSLKIDSLVLPESFFPDTTTTNKPAVWQVMNHALETLKSVDEGAYHSLKNILPQIGGKLPSLMLSYMHTAVQGGNFMAWLGESTIQALKNAGPRGESILKSLEKEFSGTQKKASDGKSLWKAYDIPFLSGAVVEPVSLYLQHTPQMSGQEKNNHLKTGNSVRFVLDLSLSCLGRIQLEGLATRSRRVFNLNIRHEKKMPETFEPTVISLFTKTLDALNYAGTVSAKQTDDFIEIRPELSDDNPLKKGFFA